MTIYLKRQKVRFAYLDQNYFVNLIAFNAADVSVTTSLIAIITSVMSS